MLPPIDSPRPAYYMTTHAGLEWSSIYPNLFSVQYQRKLSGRMVPVDKYVTGHNESSVRSEIELRDPHGEITGDIVVTLVKALDPIYR